MTEPPAKKSRLDSREAKREKFIEAVQAFKCKLCDFLGLTVNDVEEHLVSSHEVEYFGEEDWLEIAKNEDIRLQCPKCSNNFTSGSSRSFKTHLIDDHQLKDDIVDFLFEEQNNLRRKKALEFLRDQKLSQSIKRSATVSAKMEAYIDKSGELKVKSIDEEIQIDVSAERYFSTIKSESPKKKVSILPASQTTVVGRKKGSKTIGLSKLKQINPNIEMREEVIGFPCNRGRCGVRLNDLEKLKYHRERCHDEENNEYMCPECFDKKSEKFSGLWAKVAMHLWREHKIDMELLACDKCPQFRAFNRARYDDHMSKHKTERPFACLHCQKAFKQERHLKDHLVRNHGTPRQFEKDQQQQFTCNLCNRGFKTQASLSNHVKTVHEGLRPFRCQYCDFSSSNKSNLVIHERQHTGEKPYTCEHCDYRSADRNSLKKHLLRHSGVKKFFCKLCEFGTIQAVNLGYHYNSCHLQQAVEHGYLFKCSLCKYFTVHKEGFHAHLLNRHNQGAWPS